MLTSDSEAFNRVQNFLIKMKEQDNRSTAFPYFYVIRSSELIITDPDYCNDVVKYYHPDYDDLTWESEKDFVDYLKNDLNDEPFKESYIDLEVKNLRKIYFKKIWKEHGMFLTEEDAENHLKTNYYHYTSDAHTYVKHAWRAPDLHNFLNDLMDIFQVGKDTK
jgi:hypothetical protein